MKTAMQELIDNLESIDINVPNGVKLIFIEKEKQQIIDAYYGNIDGVFGYREEGEQYYNQTYNQQEDKTFKQKSKWTTQKQHIIDIMKADEDDGLYNK
jgi:glycosylphosphatidylinositol transamidase (GPIT) subunit GPI8